MSFILVLRTVDGHSVSVFYTYHCSSMWGGPWPRQSRKSDSRSATLPMDPYFFFTSGASGAWAGCRRLTFVAHSSVDVNNQRKPEIDPTTWMFNLCLGPTYTCPGLISVAGLQPRLAHTVCCVHRRNQSRLSPEVHSRGSSRETALQRGTCDMSHTPAIQQGPPGQQLYSLTRCVTCSAS
jgi:hypothetical protein